MATLLAFALTLLLAVLISELAHRSVLSVAVLFLLAGFLVGGGMLGVAEIGPENDLVRRFAELALFSVLFTDGMRVGIRNLASAWRLPGRALLLGMPLTFGITSVAAHLVAGLPWISSLLIGAVLSPTDPVFAAAIVGREEVPARLRRLLNVESGLNDGLALPVVVILLAVAERGHPAILGELGRLALGVALGVAVPWAAISLQRIPNLSAAAAYQPLYAFAIGLVLLAAGSLSGANLFLAAFSGGVTVATLAPELRRAFHRFGDLVAELLKLAALMIFGALITLTFLRDISLSGYLFALLAVVVVRPLALGIALAGSPLDRPETIAAAWFGPKGFASVVYGLLVLQSGARDASQLFHLIAIAIAISIVLHSSTDVVIARWFQQAEDAGPAPGTGAKPEP